MKKSFLLRAISHKFFRENPIMKRCPQCSRVFANDTAFCPHDAARLVEENFSLPSIDGDFEDDTVVRRQPIVVDLSKGNAPALENIRQAPPPSTADNIVVRVPAKSNSKSAAIYLALGLLLGGILVLTTLIFARGFFSNGDGGNSKQIAVNVSTQNANARNSAPANRIETNANPPNKNAIDLSANAKHDERTTAADGEFNGRVIALNAYVRASPSKSAAQTDVLPLDDRINIERRENESSPWFYVTCEHGTSGWMHGDTIEYTRNY